MARAAQAALAKAVFNHVAGLRGLAPGREIFSGEPPTSLYGTVINLVGRTLGRAISIHGVPTTQEGLDCLIPFVEKSLSEVDPMTVTDYVQGDDGIGTDCPEGAMVASFAILGLPYEEEFGDRTNTAYLNRMFTESGDSCCDVERAMRKFHLSSRSTYQHSAEALLLAKSLSYVATDSRTPVLGAMCWAFVQRNRSAGLSEDAMKLFRQRFSQADLSINDLMNLGAPDFDINRACLVAYQGWLSILEQRKWHTAWIIYGLGGPHPGPIPLSQNKHRANHTLV